ncbi:MAG: 50S ribosomal protein L13 [Desulfobacterota bacterium]|nr:50S ribosomal protein L13 [Thermodesulfobacteriota bacterium]
MKTTLAKKEQVERSWYVIDAEGKTLGRLAAHIAHRLRGKHKPLFTPHVDTGDFIIVINAEKVRLTGKKLDDKKYYHYSGYPGGLKVRTAAELLAKKPTALLYEAVKGMLPKGPLGRKMIKKLKLYAGPSHPHEAQQPQPLELRGI